MHNVSQNVLLISSKVKWVLLSKWKTEYPNLHQNEFGLFFHLSTQHEAIALDLFYTSLNNNIYPAETNHVNCILTLSFESKRNNTKIVIFLNSLNVICKVQFFFSGHINHLLSYHLNSKVSDTFKSVNLSILVCFGGHLHPYDLEERHFNQHVTCIGKWIWS